MNKNRKMHFLFYGKQISLMFRKKMLNALIKKKKLKYLLIIRLKLTKYVNGTYTAINNTEDLFRNVLLQKLIMMSFFSNLIIPSPLSSLRSKRQVHIFTSIILSYLAQITRIFILINDYTFVSFLICLKFNYYYHLYRQGKNFKSQVCK